MTDYERGWRAGVEACHDYGRDMALHFLERTAQPAATGEGGKWYPGTNFDTTPPSRRRSPEQSQGDG